MTKLGLCCVLLTACAVSQNTSESTAQQTKLVVLERLWNDAQVHRDARALEALRDQGRDRKHQHRAPQRRHGRNRRRRGPVAGDDVERRLLRRRGARLPGVETERAIVGRRDREPASARPPRSGRQRGRSPCRAASRPGPAGVPRGGRRGSARLRARGRAGERSPRRFRSRRR